MWAAPEQEPVEPETLVDFHHYAFTFAQSELATRLAGVRFVFVAGCKRRAKALANYLAESEEKQLMGPQGKIERLTQKHSRLHLFKVGLALVGDHGMGSPSLLIALHELLLTCRLAKVIRQVTVVRFGTCGGVAVEPGTLCVTNRTFDPLFQEFVELKVCQRLVRRDCIVDHDTCQLFMEIAQDERYLAEIDRETLGQFEVRQGATIATNDFYEEQGRLNGAICEHTKQDELSFLEAAREKGVINIEMESNHMLAMCHKLGVKAAVVCVSLNNRLGSTCTHLTPERLQQFQARLFWLIRSFVRHKLIKR